MANGKIALYTVITGAYDRVPTLNPAFVPGMDCYLVTDGTIEGEIPAPWKVKQVKPETDPHRHQRRLKLLFHELFPEYGTVIYMDANIHITRSLQFVLPLHKGPLTTLSHPRRNCVYQEGIACEELGKAPAPAIRNQMATYREEGIPANLGMYQTGFMIRDNTPNVREFCIKWHEELEKYTHRDQLSLMPVVYRTGFTVRAIPFNTFTGFARILKHSGRANTGMIHHLTPYDVRGNIGRAYNEACSLVPSADDWIVIRDGDTSYTTPSWGKHIADTLRKYGDDYQVYGAVTNRIRSEHQRVPGMFDEMSLDMHSKKGFELEMEAYASVRPGGTGVAGFFMAFRKSTWEQNPFRENDRTFDTMFCKDVRRKGGKIGIIEGLYILHLYRIWSPDPVNEISHLVKTDS